MAFKPTQSKERYKSNSSSDSPWWTAYQTWLQRRSSTISTFMEDCMILICFNKHIKHVFMRNGFVVLLTIFTRFIFITFLDVGEICFFHVLWMIYLELFFFHPISYILYSPLCELSKLLKNLSIWRDSSTSLSTYSAIKLVYRTNFCTSILHLYSSA